MNVANQQLPLLESVHKNFISLSSQTFPAEVIGEEDLPYSNVTGTWAGTLDYIFTFDSKYAQTYKHTITPTQLLDLPPYSVLKSHGGLPNREFSSDHVCVMCEFRLF